MFRFTIRDLLWLTVVVALGVGWWLNYSKTRDALSKLAESNRRVLFYMEIVQRLQNENYKLKREANDFYRSRASGDVRGFTREYFEKLLRDTPNCTF